VLYMMAIDKTGGVAAGEAAAAVPLLQGAAH